MMEQLNSGNIWEGNIKYDYIYTNGGKESHQLAAALRLTDDLYRLAPQQG